jgi:hypothetical protein
MALSNIDTITGISSLVMLILGYGLGIKTITIWMKKKANIILLTALLFFALPTPWLEFTLRFIFALFDGEIGDTFGMFIFAWSIPVLVTSWVYITSSLYKNQEWFKYVALAITVIPGIIFIISIYFLQNWEVTEIAGSIAKNYEYVPLEEFIIYYFGALGIGIVFPSYIYFSNKSEDKLFKFKSRMIAFSVLLFTIAGISDATIAFDSAFNIVILRVVLMISLILLYLGYNTPTRIKDRYS